MTTTVSDSLTCRNAEHEPGRGCDPQLIVELLDDEDSRRLYQDATTPATVNELAEALDLPLSTAYRKVATLEEAGLLTPLVQDPGKRGEPTRYVRAIDRVSVTLDDRLRIECTIAGVELYCEP